MRIGLIGYGGLGRAFVELLHNKRKELADDGLDISLNYVINSRGGVYNKAGIDLGDFLEFSKSGDVLSYNGGGEAIDFSKIAENRDIDLLVETTPTNKETGEPGLSHISNALDMGINVVTANKGPILLEYKKLREKALKSGVQLGIGCTTGGALPTINGGIMSMAGSKILSIEGVLNGTTNFILKEMEDNGVTYVDALKKAQAMGIAEANPELDVEGYDTAIKLLILTNVLMEQDKKLNEVNIEGITKITPEEIAEALKDGERYKLIGKSVLRDEEVEMTVKPQRLSINHPLYGVDGKNKAVRYASDTLGDLTLIGGASGTMPAAASILRDIVNIHRGYRFVR